MQPVGDLDEDDPDILAHYRKMFNQNKSLDEIFDLFAFRVLVDTVGDCYTGFLASSRVMISL